MFSRFMALMHSWLIRVLLVDDHLHTDMTRHFSRFIQRWDIVQTIKREGCQRCQT